MYYQIHAYGLGQILIIIFSPFIEFDMYFLFHVNKSESKNYKKLDIYMQGVCSPLQSILLKLHKVIVILLPAWEMFMSKELFIKMQKDLIK